jgi:phosphatidylglycerophosphatase A
VVDEIAGMLLAFVAVPLSIVPLLTGFALFRLFDIVKPTVAAAHHLST